MFSEVEDAQMCSMHKCGMTFSGCYLVVQVQRLSVIFLNETKKFYPYSIASLKR